MERRCVTETGVRGRPWLLSVVGLLALLFTDPTHAEAQEPPRKEEGDPSPPIGRFLRISGTVDDTVYGRVSRAALGLQSRARQESRRAVLVLEISPGSSPFHQVRGLAKFLTTELTESRLRTVAWVPETVTGSHVILALACQEIVMAPAASLGDIGLGQPLDQDEQSFVVNLVNRRHNNKVSEALALGMLDRQKEVLWAQVELGTKPNPSRETRIISRAAYDDLARAGAQIIDVKTIKEVGAPGLFTGERARSYDVLAMHLAQSRSEVGALYRLPREAMREDHTAGEAPRVMLIHIDDMIEPILEQFVLRQIERAVASGTNLLVFQIHSPGGFLRSSVSLANAIADLHDRRVRTVAYVPKEALSGAAIVALGCDEIYLAPDAQIGDAGPIEVREGQAFERAPEKILGPLRISMKSLAERKRRPPALAMAMADKDLLIYQVTNRDTGQVWFMTENEIHESGGKWIQGRQVPNTGNGKLLTLSGEEAHAVQLAEPPVHDFAELKSRLGVSRDTEIPVSARIWVDTLIYILNTPWATSFLFLLGIMCIYLELHFPSGMFGIMACVCFGVFFWSRFLGGTAGWLEVVLFLLGAGCIAIEFFVVPGFGVFGVSGILLCVFSLILASQTFIIPTSAADVSVVVHSIGTLSGAAIGTVVLIALVSRFLPSIPLFNEMILTPPGADALSGPRLRPELTGSVVVNPVLERDQLLIGKQGRSVTVLRPAGKAQIADEFVDVVSEGPFISAGRRIEVIAVSGNRVVVRELT
jgi:membrane-bound serine protease (ClpP class)